MSRSIHINDTWTESDSVHHKLIASMSGPEAEYEPPRVWPHQVPIEKRKVKQREELQVEVSATLEGATAQVVVPSSQADTHLATPRPPRVLSQTGKGST